MADFSFTFKQFTVYQSRCAMKVGTDGVLLGAWTPVEGARTALDVGTGTGLIALQLAQRHAELRIEALDIDSDAASQAQENIASSPWGDRIHVACMDFCQFHSTENFDLIVSNPPYFVNALKCPDAARNRARHAEGLNYDTLFQHASRLLVSEGKMSVIVPCEVEDRVMDAAWMQGLYPQRITRVCTKVGKPPRRLLMKKKKKMGFVEEDVLYICGADGAYSEAYKELTRDFYLKF